MSDKVEFVRASYLAPGRGLWYARTTGKDARIVGSITKIGKAYWVYGAHGKDDVKYATLAQAKAAVRKVI